MKQISWGIVLAAFLLAGCGANAPTSGVPTLPYVLVTSAPNASPTATPFQPVSWTATASPLSQLVLDSTSPTLTFSPPAQTETPTADPNFLI
ncbi:MAG TPA: hypothetical protein VLA72_01300, partial [Anaerolineales bacterium]|nr:hypothetical protein [Anaerolineales bacterium]